MLEFVMAVVFTRKVKDFVNPDIGYSGVVGLAPLPHPHPEDEQEQSTGWKDVGPPAHMDPIEWQINRAIDAMNRLLHAPAAAKHTSAQDGLAMVNHVVRLPRPNH
ncbi:hypothetical protein BGZ50_005231 [Haplosporangium sp. Z 11]|nr:hypothetical protein BGZ50_005231 [Haplosporangium sp. Z 11]